MCTSNEMPVSFPCRLLYCRKLYRKAFVFRPKRSPYVTEERKFAILFAATILAVRKLIDMDPDKPNMAKGYFVGDSFAFGLRRVFPAEMILNLLGRQAYEALLIRAS